MLSNPQLQLAFDFVQYTNKNVFLTGKAGTGKTTFLRNLKQQSPKRMVVVAPTGVAAINAGGVTIHSFFQLPFSPFIPDAKTSFQENKINRDKIKIIRSIDLLVIDEISMVRADILDAIDDVLRRFRRRDKPFGGVQLLMIGDLHQLAPVIKDDEWELLKPYYSSVFFFGSRALQQTDYVSIELTHIFRQSDQHFIQLLNQVRENRFDDQTLEKLNSRYKADILQRDNDGYIILTTHNHLAQSVNDRKLSDLGGEAHFFSASVQNDFPSYMYPTDNELILKIGAQVMFVKNDSSHEKLYFNGKIGKITGFDNDKITVQCPGDYYEIAVQPEEWKNTKYEIDPQTKEIKENVAGTFRQYPLKLAWAITIHKSQGLTFEKAIIDAQSAFAFGQVYVALSRCKSIEGLILSTPITRQSIKTDVLVSDFTRNIEANQPSSDILLQAKHQYQQFLLAELFDFRFMRYRLSSIFKYIEQYSSSFASHITDAFTTMNSSAITDILEVSEKFDNQLNKLIAQNPDIESNETLQERVKKAAVYFGEKLETILITPLKNMALEADNKTAQIAVEDLAETFFQELYVKKACLTEVVNGFDVKKYLDTKAKTTIDTPQRNEPKKQEYKYSGSMQNANLYNIIKTWRNDKAADNNVDVYMILPQKTITEIVTQLPCTIEELKKVKGFGQKKIKQFGNEIIAMVAAYCNENNIKKVPVAAAVNQTLELTEQSRSVKTSTKIQTLELHKEGKSVTEIARIRGLATSTIESHIAEFAKTGEVNLDNLIDAEKRKRIAKFYYQTDDKNLTTAKHALGDNISYFDIRLIYNYLEHLSQIDDDI